MTTGKLAAWGSRLRSLASFGGQALLRLARRSAEGAKVGSSQTISSCQRTAEFALGSQISASVQL